MTHPPAPFRLRTFGGLALERVDAASDAPEPLRAGKPLALLAYLAAEGPRPVARTLVADLLWGDESPEAARASLRQAVHVLRRQLGGAALIADRNTVALADGALDTDHAAFLAAVRAGDADAMLEAYRGPFLHAIELRGASGLDRWVAIERDRLRGLLLGGIEHALESLRSTGAVRQAAQLTRRLLEVESMPGALLPACAEALVADGAFGEARALLETHRARARADDADHVSPALERRLEQVGRALQADERGAATRSEAIEWTRRFVGREDVLAECFRRVERARGGRASRLTLLGPPGIGKSRVLDEFEARLRSRVARVLRVRFDPGLRPIPQSGLAAVARAACALPGAMGVGERSASVLVEMLPELRAQFPAAPPLVAAAGDLPRLRVEALADLVAAIAEDRLAVFLLDDVHNLDDVSRAGLDAACARPDLRLFVLRSSRVSDAEPSAGADALSLPPLAAAEVRTLLEGAGRLPDAPWVPDAVEALAARSRGIPQQLLQGLLALDRRGAIRITEGAWSALDATELTDGDAMAADLDAVLGSLPSARRRALQALATWRRPLREQDLVAVLSLAGERSGERGWREALEALEAAGLAVAREDGWSVAHDTVAERVLALQSSAESEQLAHAFVSHAAASGALTVPVLEHVALVVGARANVGAAEALVRVASRDHGLMAMGLRGRALARRIAASAGQPAWEGRLLDAIGWWRRRSRRALVALGSAGGFLVGAVLWYAWMLWPRLVVESRPIADVGSDAFALAVQPRVAVVDGFGRVRRGHKGTVRVWSDEATLYGDTIVAIEDGEAQFERITGVYDTVRTETEELWFRYSADGLTWGTSGRVAGGWHRATDAFTVLHIVVNDVEIGPAHRARVHVGDSVRVAVSFEYTTVLSTANYPVGAMALWAPRPQGLVRLAGLARPVREAFSHVEFVMPPSDTAGVSHVVILMAAESSIEHIFSLTNWTLGLPRWDDGLDVSDATPDQLRSLRDSGWADFLADDRGYQGRQSLRRRGARLEEVRPMWMDRSNKRFLGTAIEIEFQAPAAR